MAFNLDSISQGNPHRPPRIILLGTEKIGKSTFAAQSNRPIILPMAGEEGVDDLGVDQFPPMPTMQAAIESLSALHSGTHDYGTVVLDSASALEPLVWKATCDQAGVESIEKVGGGYGKGYTEALAYWRTVAQWLDALRADRDMASIIIGHVKVKRFDDPLAESYDRYTFDIHEKAANLLYRWADVILFANTKVAVTKEEVGFNKEKHRAVDVGAGQRFLFTRQTPAHPGGGRGIYGHLPYELPLSWAAFQAAIADRMAGTMAETQ